jgi:hypothetical protein
MSTEPEHLAVDRFESGIAILVSDNGDVLEVERSGLPDGIIPGDVISVTRNHRGDILWNKTSVDEEATADRLAQAKTILEELRGRDPGGNITL